MAETRAETRPTEREDIVQVLRDVSVGPGQTLRQVQVPDNAYRLARFFLKWAPNKSVGTGNSRVPLRYKVLHSIPPSDSIYTLLIADAGHTPISAAKGKIEEWKEATKSLLRYALNLKLAPKRPEFLRMKLSSSYYVYQVAKKLQGAERILLCMGYEAVGSQSSELKYSGDVRMELVIDTAVDLVVLHADLDLINGLVLAAQQENYRNMILYDILSARSEQNDTLTNTLARSTKICFQRIMGSKPPRVVHAPAIPPRTHQPPQHLYVSSDSAAIRRSSAPNIKQEMSAPELPHSPLLQVQGQTQGEQCISLPSQNSKEDFNKVDKTIDKSGGVGKDSVDPKYPIIIARSPSGSRYKSGSTSFDPDKLPEPAFDTHDLEMFHQEEARSPDDSIMSGHISMFIDARSTEFDDFSGPNLDDHLSFRSHDSGHEGLPGIPQSNINAAEDDEDRCISGINVSDVHGIVGGQVPRVEEALYEQVKISGEKEEPGSTVSFQVGHDSSVVSKPAPKSMNQIESPSTPTPQPRPRSYSGGKKQPDVPKADKKPQAMPRPMSHQNLLSTKVPTPPRSPQRDKPVAKPRQKKVSPTDTPLVREPVPQAVSETLPTIDNNDEINTMSTLPSSNITSIHTSSSSSILPSDPFNDHLGPESLVQHAEAHTSHESDSPHPSLEQTPSMSSKSDPHSGSSHDNASSACFEKVFTETNVEDSLGSWVQIDVENKESHSRPSSLGSAPIRKRADAFSARPDKTVDKKPATPDVSEICYDPRLVQLSHDIQNATPCWYCMNLTTDRICDICGNEQKQNKETMV